MSDQHNSGSSDGSGASPWNSPDNSTGTPAGGSEGYGRTDASGQNYGGDAPSYSQSSYPDSAYGSGGATAGQSTYGSQTDQYGGGYAPGSKPKGLAIAALVVGILSILFAAPILGIIIGIVAIVLGVMARGRVKRGVADGGGLALAGIITGIIGALISLLLTVLFGAVFAALIQTGSIDAIIECSQLPTEAQQQACIEQYVNETEQQQNT